ncbi:YeeE/YedE family integral membrane protein [Dendryphion nanum]|uniref:YeeE/YedE family integral membrane protein n=1 Tax=Dendryphion nanum TaxID=256645 RepID=A0A9P9ICT8_9PLEO|nr:YeeE/YedE family integral membrane protein [Dendryphion nanum]
MFTPVETSIGALLLHQATSVLLYQNGNILGVSGYLRRLFSAPTKETLSFFAGMAASLLPLKIFLPELITNYPPIPSTAVAALVTIAVGVLVGYGTKMSNGCTSGHMLCGLSRLSGRSTTAVAIFFPTAILTHHLVHPTLITDACSSEIPCYLPVYPTYTTSTKLAAFAIAIILIARMTPRYVEKVLIAQGKHDAQSSARQLVQFFAGLEFGLGLHISQMASPSKVLSFLSFPRLQAWDPSLALVILFGVLPNLIEIQARGFEITPLFSDKFELPKKTIRDVDWKFVVGAAAFGMGWGLTGTCPGPAFLRAVVQPTWGLLWMGGLVVGNKMAW